MSGKTGPQLVSIEWRTPQLDELHPLVQERLRALRIEDLSAAPDARAWQSVLEWASERIGALEEDRKRLAISIEVEHELCNLVTAERKQRAELEREVGLAADVQRCFVPRAVAVEYPGLGLSSFYRPADSCGGDWWSAYDLPADKVMIVIGDVTGHGVAPAMMTGVAKGAADVIVRKTPAKHLTPAAMLEEMNLSICNAGTDSLMMTCAVAVIDPRASSVAFASAGHPLPYVVRGESGERILKQLVANGNPLGASIESEYENSSMSLEVGDAIIWYTDGVLDVENERGEAFGEKRLRYILRYGGSIAPTDLRETLWGAMFEFMGKAAPVDDITFIAARFGKPPRRRRLSTRS